MRYLKLAGIVEPVELYAILADVGDGAFMGAVGDYLYIWFKDCGVEEIRGHKVWRSDN